MDFNSALRKLFESTLKSTVAFGCIVLYLVVGNFCVAAPADFEDVRSAYFSGDYDKCIELSKEQVESGIWNDFWARQLVDSLLVQGRYEDAVEVYELVEKKFANSLPLRIMASEAYRFSGDAEKGDQLLDQIPGIVEAAPWRFSDRENLLALGKYMLDEGEDAREVLTACYDRILKSDAEYVDAHVAIGQLALQKADYQEAAKSLSVAARIRPEDPAIQCLLAKAWAPSDDEKATAYLQAALDLNPRHTESLLMQSQNLIAAERFDDAEEILGKVLELNKFQPAAWAQKAAIAHLRGEYQLEGEFRGKGLQRWAVNPLVDHLIGSTLSKNYRFEESVKYQRRALKFDPDFMPARFQLAQDLLRVGKDEEGWALVDAVASDDKYNVVAYNLSSLRNRLAKFATIEADGLIIRMDARESRIYGQQVVKLLRAAQETLSKKYQVELRRPITVEIFPQQSDFAIRTFGVPGGAGFLGVCFGSLITANSPASQGDTPTNWESVLWHEFCHVVTLQKTNNRMPRWLSEGISVYEELERNPAWGQSMSPAYQSMILGQDFVPLSKLSSAFLSPKSGMHLQFAYYESSLAVRYLIERHGLDRLIKLLDDLGMGATVQDAFDRRYGDREILDNDFAAYAKGLASGFAPDTDFGREGLPENASPMDLEQWLKDHPNSYFAQSQLVRRSIQAKKWQDAKEQAERLEALYPTDDSPGGALDLLATIHRELEDQDSEFATLEKWVALSADNVPALLRLMELSEAAESWDKLLEHSQGLLAVQPLLTRGHEGAILAARNLGLQELVLPSLKALKEMEPLDPAGLQFELAQALFDAERIEEARAEVLYALEQAPRFREAQRLLLAINNRRAPAGEATQEATTSDTATTPSKATADRQVADGVEQDSSKASESRGIERPPRPPKKPD